MTSYNQVKHLDGYEPEQVWLSDQSGSFDFPISPSDDRTTRQDVMLPAMKLVVATIAEEDEAYIKSVQEGRPEEAKGGVLTFTFSSSGRARTIGDLNPGNWNRQTSNWTAFGHTYIMDAVALWKAAQEKEFAEDEEAKEEKVEYNVIVTTDGRLDDENQFMSWVSQQPANYRFFFFLIGYGDDNKNVIQHYRDMQQAHPDRIAVFSLQDQSDPQDIADSILSAIRS